MDIVFIRDVRLSIAVGMYEREKVTPQTVQIDLEIGLPGTGASQSAAVDAPPHT